ncbi:hypothetical protein [Paenibacillus sp. FSL R5-0701]
MKKIVLMLMVSLMACIPWVTVVEASRSGSTGQYQRWLEYVRVIEWEL